MSIAVAIITKNEIRHIRDVISNAKELTNDIVVIDSGSTDGTVEVAEELGAKVVYRAWDDFASQRNYAMECTEADWIVYMDADERMSEELLHSLREVSESTDYAVYQCMCHNRAFGQDFKYGVLSPNDVKRIFPRNKAHWVGEVHERVEGNLPVRPIKGFFKHDTYVDFAHYLGKQNLYSTMWARDHKGKKKVSVLKDFALRPAFAFIKMYFFKRGFLEGPMGFVLACGYMNYTLSKYVKLYFENKKMGNQ